MNRHRKMLALLLCVSSCLWRSYGTILAVHVDVLTQTADKLCAVVESRRGLSAESMAEYVYPAQRGREFLRQFESYQGHRSYQEFTTFLDRYEKMVRSVDAQRAGNGQIDLLGLQTERDGLRQSAMDIRAELARGD